MRLCRYCETGQAYIDGCCRDCWAMKAMVAAARESGRHLLTHYEGDKVVVVAIGMKGDLDRYKAVLEPHGANIEVVDPMETAEKLAD